MTSKLDPALWSCQILIFIINYCIILIIIINIISVFLCSLPKKRISVISTRNLHMEGVCRGVLDGHLGLVCHFSMFEFCCRQRAPVMLLEFIAFLNV